MRTTLQNCNQLQPRLLPEFDLRDPTEMTEQRKEEHLKDAEKMLSYLDLYWTAVRSGDRLTDEEPCLSIQSQVYGAHASLGYPSTASNVPVAFVDLNI
jgi:hypothetical protein